MIHSESEERRMSAQQRFTSHRTYSYVSEESEAFSSAAVELAKKETGRLNLLLLSTASPNVALEDDDRGAKAVVPVEIIPARARTAEAENFMAYFLLFFRDFLFVW